MISGTRPRSHSSTSWHDRSGMMSAKVLRYALGFKTAFLSKSLFGTKLAPFSTKCNLPVLTLYTKVSLILEVNIRRVAEVFGRVFVLTGIFIKGGY